MEDGDVIDAVLQQVREMVLVVRLLRTVFPRSAGGWTWVCSSVLVRLGCCVCIIGAIDYVEAHLRLGQCDHVQHTLPLAARMAQLCLRKVFPSISFPSLHQPRSQRSVCGRLARALPAHLPRTVCKGQWLLGVRPH